MIRKEQIETPALLIDMDALDYNIGLMAGYMGARKAALRPHFKTHRCVAIAHMQLAAGAKGMTCAKLGEAEVLAAAGVRDILIANQVVEPAKIARLAGLAREGTKLAVAVDNAENIAALSAAASEAGSVLHVLVEVDVGMGRCGVNTPEEAYALAAASAGAKGLVFEGIQAYEGQLSHVADEGARRQGVERMAEKVGGIQRYLEAQGLPVRQISGGCTGTYDITGDDTIWTEIQAGSYPFMDTAYGALGLGFRSALTVLTTVVHKRPGAAVTDAGMKVCTTDEGLPALKDLIGPRIRALHEEHGVLIDECDQLAYLQKIEYIPSHCCTTVNLFDRYHCVRGGVLEAVWPIAGRGRSQ